MKKVLLTSLIIGSSFAGFSQGIRAAQPGYAWENFSSATEYSDKVGDDPALGIYLWKDTLNINTPYIQLFEVKNDGVLKSKKTRAGDGKVSYTVSQPYGLFVPQFGVSFGEGKSINLTGTSSAILRIGIKPDLTTVPEKGIKVKFAIKDVDSVGIDSKGTNGGTNIQWQDEIMAVISKTGAVTVPGTLKNTITTTTLDGVITFTVNFEGGYEAVYPVGAPETCVGDTRGDQGELGASAPKTNFDATKVRGFQLTFLQDDNADNADCYLKKTLTDFKFDVTGFNLGDLTVNIADEQLFNKSGFVAYPSPIKGGSLKLSATAENVKVYDVVGNVVFSANSASEINVDGFSKGLYVVKSSKGTTRFVVE